MAIPDSDIAALKAHMPQVLKHYGIDDLHHNFSCLWREDRNPSAAFYRDTNLVHDFGDGTTVDVFGLVGRVEGIARFPDQVRRVAEIVGYHLSPEVDDRRLRPSSVRRSTHYAAPVRAGWPEYPMLPFAMRMADLLENDIAKGYLRSRGFEEATAYENVLGFVRTPKEVSSAFTLDEPTAVRGYIVIPFSIDDTFCTVDYCTLRAIPGDEQPRYKEMRPARTKSPLYREWMLSAGLPVLYVTEGVFDCLALEALIDKPCMALGGTSLAGRFASVLHYTPPEMRPAKVIVATDADDAGCKAADKMKSDLNEILC